MEGISLGISFGSINTGLPKDIVDQIIKAERIPINKMEERKGKFGEKSQLLEELIGLVEGLRGEVLSNGNARSLREFKVISNEEIVDVTVDKNIVEPGSYQFEVSRLAQKSSAMSSAFEDPDEDYLGVGFIQYTLPDGETRDVYVDSDNSSLNGVAKLINKDTENGMRAYVVNDGSQTEAPWRLIISLEKTGDENHADFPYMYFVDGVDDFYLEYEREAIDAAIKIDGFEVEVSENKAADLLPGVNIDLKKAMPGEEFTIQIVEDVGKISEKINGIVASINEVLKFIKVQNTLNESTDTSRTLGGDITLQTLESRLRSVVFQPIKTEFGVKRLGDLGINFKRDGLLNFDENKFQGIVGKDYKMASQVLTGFFDEDGLKSRGFIDHLKQNLDGILLRPNGVLPSRKQGIQTKIDQIDRQISNRERMLEQKEKNLKDKFARLEGTISRLKSQGAGLSALGAGSSPVTQLG